MEKFSTFDLVLLHKQHWSGDASHELESHPFNQYPEPLPRSDKECVPELLSSSHPTCCIVISTVALGMGLNCPDISRVIHYGVPTTIEAYYQESGRCERNGKHAVTNAVIQRAYQGSPVLYGEPSRSRLMLGKHMLAAFLSCAFWTRQF